MIIIIEYVAVDVNMLRNFYEFEIGWSFYVFLVLLVACKQALDAVENQKEKVCL